MKITNKVTPDKDIDIKVGDTMVKESSLETTPGLISLIDNPS